MSIKSMPHDQSPRFVMVLRHPSLIMQPIDPRYDVFVGSNGRFISLGTLGWNAWLIHLCLVNILHMHHADAASVIDSSTLSNMIYEQMTQTSMSEHGSSPSKFYQKKEASPTATKSNCLKTETPKSTSLPSTIPDHWEEMTKEQSIRVISKTIKAVTAQLIETDGEARMSRFLEQINKFLSQVEEEEEKEEVPQESHDEIGGGGATDRTTGSNVTHAVFMTSRKRINEPHSAVVANIDAANHGHTNKEAFADVAQSFTEAIISCIAESLNDPITSKQSQQE